MSSNKEELAHAAPKGVEPNGDRRGSGAADRASEGAAKERGRSGSGRASHAIIYLPDLSWKAPDADHTKVAARFTAALQGAHPGEVFNWSKVKDVHYGPKSDEDVDNGTKSAFTSAVYRVSPDPSSAKPVGDVDICMLDYRDRLLGDWKQRSLPVQVLGLSLYLGAGYLKALRPLFTRRRGQKGKSLVHRVQALWMLTLLAFVSVYFALLAGVLVTQAREVWGFLRVEAVGERADASEPAIEVGAAAEGAPLADPVADTAGRDLDAQRAEYVPPLWWEWLVGWLDEARSEIGDWIAAVVGENLGAALSRLVGLAAALWLLIAELAGRLWRQVGDFVAPLLIVGAVAVVAVKRSREWIEDKAITCIGAWEYLTPGLRHAEVVGQVSALVSHLSSEEGAAYKQVYLVGHSFGSIVAIDALFPFEDDAPAAGYDKVTGLVTVGCPFDLVRTFFARYTAPRWRRAGEDLTWRNVYCPRDVLGSNFRNDMHQREAEEGVTTGVRGRQLFAPKSNAPHRDESAQDEQDGSSEARGFAAVAVFGVGVVFLLGLGASTQFAQLTAGVQLLLVVLLLVVLPVAVLLFSPSLSRTNEDRPATDERRAETDCDTADQTSPRTVCPENEIFRAGAHDGATGPRALIPPGFKAHGWYFSDQPGAEDAAWMMLPRTLRAGSSP